MDSAIQTPVTTATSSAEESRRDQGPVSESAATELKQGSDLATVVTSGEAVDFEAAFNTAIDSDDERVATLSASLLAGGKDVKNALGREERSRKALYRALCQIRAAADGAYATPEVLVAAVRASTLKVTKASWASPYLVPLKLALPDLPAKLASDYAKALNYTTAAGIADNQLEAFLSQHGIVALAREETKRQRAKKGADQQPQEDPVEVLCREQEPVKLPARLDIEGMPPEGQLALLVIGGREGGPVAWGIDTDEKAVTATARRLLKQKRAADSPAQKPEAKAN